VTLFDFSLGILKLFSHVAFSLFGFGQLDFDEAQRSLQLLVFDLAQAKHLFVLHFGSFLTLDTQSAASNQSLLSRVV